jgi:hypothetical protein
MSALARVTFLVGIAAGCAAIAGCGADTPTQPQGEGSGARISGDVFVVDGKTGLSLVDAGDSLLVYDVLGRMPAIPPGAVVVGTDGGGYIRRVRSVLADGNRLVLRTTPAVLTDAVITGILDETTSIGFSGSGEAARNGAGREELVAAVRGVSVSESGLNLSNIVLFSGDSGGVA